MSQGRLDTLLPHGNSVVQAHSTAAVVLRYPLAQLVNTGGHRRISLSSWLRAASTDLGFYYSLKICLLWIELCSILSSCFMRLYFEIP